MARKFAAELIGTFVLVFFGVGSAVFGIDRLGPVGVALAFGLTLLALAYGLGGISGAHVNPAVTLGILLAKGITAAEAAGYVIAQLVGAIAGAAVIRGLVGFGHVTDQTGGLGTNAWGKTITGPGAFVLEIVLTFLLVLVVLLVTGVAAAPGFAGLAIGLTLTAIHLVGIPLDGTSVNPARSLGPALLHGGQSLHQLWLFIVAPLIGAAVAAAVFAALKPGLTGTARTEDPSGARSDNTAAVTGAVPDGL